MWYGKNAPAPAAKVHPLYQKMPLSKRMPLQKFQWAPLEEPARRRRDEWKRQQSLIRAGIAMTRSGSTPDMHSEQYRASIELLALEGSRPSSSLSRDRVSTALSPLMETDRKSQKKVSLRFDAMSARSSRVRSRQSSQSFHSDEAEESANFGPNPSLRRVTLADKMMEAKLQNVAAQTKSVLTVARKFDRSRTEANLCKGAVNEGEIPPIKQRAEAVFTVFQRTSSEIMLGAQLAEAFLMLDVPYPNEEVLHSLLSRQLNGRSSLDKEDFLKLVTTYEDQWRGKLDSIFKEELSFDDRLPVAKLPKLFAEADLTLMPGARRDLLKQMEVENVTQVTAADFTSIVEDAISRAGLLDREYVRVSESFEASEGDDGTVSAQELKEILSWNEHLLGLAGNGMRDKVVMATVQRINEGRINVSLAGWIKEIEKIQHVDSQAIANCSVRIVGSAVIAAARVLHDRIETGLRNVMQKVGWVRGSLSLTKVVAVIEEIGYFGVTLESLKHFMQVCNLPPNTTALDFDDLYVLLLKYVDHNGHTDAEEADLADIFRKFDDDGSGTLEASELGPVIRWLGYQPTQYRIYSFAVDVGLEEDSQLNLRQFRRMVANYHRMSLRRVRDVFVSGVMPSGQPILNSDISTLLQMVGYEPTVEEVETLEQHVGDLDARLDFATFKKVELSHRHHVRKTMEETEGVTASEYKKYQNYFDDNENGDGFITNKAMRALLGKLFPSSILDRTRHLRIAQMVKDADFDGNGLFDFQEFKWLMNRVTEDMDRDNLIKGLQLKHTLGYSGAEVKQFKDLYSLSDEDMSGSIDLNELLGLLETLLPIDREARFELQHRFRQVSTNGSELDFWEFLTMMRNIQRDNWMNINGVVGKRFAESSGG